MLIGIEGGLGSGKTIKLVQYLKEEHRCGKHIMCNIGLTNIPYEQVDIHKLLEYNDTAVSLNNLVLGIDELTVFADCRTSGGGKSNRIFSYLVLQSRKRSVDIYYTTQDIEMIDWRVVAHTSIFVYAEKLFIKDFPSLRGKVDVDPEDDSIMGIRRYIIKDRRNPRHIRIKRFFQDITPFYDLYDTDEIVVPNLVQDV